MKTWMVLIVTVFIGVLSMLGCSGRIDNPALPSIENSLLTGQTAAVEPSNTYMLGYYDIYFDPATSTFEAVLNRNASFTLNIVPFLNKMTIPKNGITFDQIVIHNDDPSFIGVDVVFSIYHPFPGYPQYNAYDARGVLIGNGASVLEYSGLSAPKHGTDVWMKNPDGYTRWFNPSEFTTQLIFGYAPGGYQNLAGDANLNPYKYYGKHLGADDNLWSWLTSGPNYDGIFESGSGRKMEIEFPMPPDGLGIMFGYAVVVTWEEQGPVGPYHAVHCPESVAAKVTQTPDVWYDPGTGNSGGNLILDIDLFAWDEQPSTVKIESSVLDGIAEFDFDTYASPGGENYSTWHVEAPTTALTSNENHYYWVIAEDAGYDYKNGLPEIPSADGKLAAFFRYDLEVLSGSSNHDPDCDLQTVTPLPAKGWDVDVPVELDASGSTDADGDPLTFEWDFDWDGIYGEDPDDSFTGTPENPTHHYTADYSGQVCVKVTDGFGGESVCCADVDVIAFPSKNISLRTGVRAVDITVDHTNGDLLVLYEDRTIYKHTLDQGYQDGYQYLDLNDCGHLPKIMFALDMAPNRYLGISLSYVTDETPGYFIYDPDGGFNIYAGQGPPTAMVDSYAMTAGIYQNDMGFIRGVEWPGIHDTLALRLTLVDGWYAYGDLYQYDITDDYTFGIDRIYYPYIKGTESDAYGNYIWTVEDPDYYAARWELTYDGPYGKLQYSNAYFGTGVPTDSDDGWNHACDITRDNQNRYFVLDVLSNMDPRVKVWTVEGDNTTSIGGFGDSTTISQMPLRIEGSDFNGEIVVLHGDADSCMASVFVPSEMPD
jgi:hypothetical protein